MIGSKLDKTIPASSAGRIYDFLGKRYDWLGAYDARAKRRALELAELAPGQRWLEVGVGTGKEHARIQKAISPQGIAFGMDISRVMLSVTKERCATPLCQADAHFLPFVSNTFDRLYAAYVLDLLPIADIPGLTRDFCRVLKPGGRMVVIALTEGVDFLSRLLVNVWKAAYDLSPVVCAGCRPLQLSHLVDQAGFKQIRSEVVVQLTVPSEILIATK